jgi:hypothetical protein
VDYLYSLYDALVSIHVPSDKARAVVDAMERDMGTTLATKQDLKLLEHQLAGVRTELRQEIQNRYELLSREIGSLRADMDKDIGSLRSDVGKDLEALRLSMTLRLGSMLAVVAGVIISVILGVLRLWL